MICLATGNPLRLATAVAVLLAFAACEDDVTHVGPPFQLPNDYAFVTTTNFSTGSAAIVSADTLLKTACSLRPIHTDAIARFFEGYIYVVNRDGADNVQVLDPYSGFATIKQFSIGTGSDPHDIAFLSRSRAFVTRYNSDQLWIVNTNTGIRSGQIDFFWLADADNVPEMDRMIRINTRIFVSVQRLNRNLPSSPPTGTSYVAVFDGQTEQFIDADPFTTGVQAIRLVGTNPNGEMVLNPATPVIWVPVAGAFGALDGGLEVINPQTLASQMVLTESQLGGDITDVVPIDANRGVAIVRDLSSNTMLVGFDLLVSGPIDTLYAPGANVLRDAELSRDGRIFLSDRALAAEGLRVFNKDTGAQLTASPVDVCLPPNDIVFGRK